MSEVFSSNERLFVAGLAEYKARIEKVSYEPSERRDSALADAQTAMMEADQRLREMEIELAVLAPSVKAELQPRVRQYRMNFDAAKRQYLSLQESQKHRGNQDLLMGPNIEDGTTGQNARLISHDDMLRKQNDLLVNAKKTGYAINDMAIDIEHNIEDQNARAAGSREKARAIQGMLGESNSIISRMLRREMLSKLVLGGIAAIVIIALLVIIYFKLFR